MRALLSLSVFVSLPPPSHYLYLPDVCNVINEGGKLINEKGVKQLRSRCRIAAMEAAWRRIVRRVGCLSIKTHSWLDVGRKPSSGRFTETSVSPAGPGRSSFRGDGDSGSGVRCVLSSAPRLYHKGVVNKAVYSAAVE